jgi:hypothetical protein
MVSTIVTYTGAGAAPEAHLAINEIMYHPAVPDTEFLEIHNTSTTHAFDLTGFRLRGVDFDFEPGTIIEPNGFWSCWSRIWPLSGLLRRRPACRRCLQRTVASRWRAACASCGWRPIRHRS